MKRNNATMSRAVSIEELAVEAAAEEEGVVVQEEEEDDDNNSPSAKRVRCRDDTRATVAVHHNNSHDNNHLSSEEGTSTSDNPRIKRASRSLQDKESLAQASISLGNESTQPPSATTPNSDAALPRQVSEEYTADDAPRIEEQPNTTTNGKGKSKNKSRSTKAANNNKASNNNQGSLDALVAQKYQGNFRLFFDSLLQEMQAPTFSFSGFVRRSGVPRARETLRNIACYLQGQPTNQFLAECWKQRVQAYLKDICSRGGKDKNSSNDDSNADLTADAGMVTPPGNNNNNNKGDICHSHKRARMRGREGALDKLVMTKFQGNFFAFLARIEDEMHSPDFMPTHFCRQHGIPSGRETLRHIVSHLKHEYTSSDRLLAQMWKDRIRVYQESKGSVGEEERVGGGDMCSGSGVPQEHVSTDLPEVTNICGV